MIPKIMQNYSDHLYFKFIANGSDCNSVVYSECNFLHMLKPVIVFFCKTHLDKFIQFLEHNLHITKTTRTVGIIC